MLHQQQKGLKLTLLEALEIWKALGTQGLLNEQTDLNYNLYLSSVKEKEIFSLWIKVCFVLFL